MSAKGDARPERQSSWLDALRRASLGRSGNHVRIAFAGFVLLHSLIQAYRAAGAGALPEPGLESAPPFVAILLLGVWLPFLILAGRELSLARRIELPRPMQEGRRALERIEPVALFIVFAFAVLHTAQLAWPLLVGNLLASDVRPELIALLSSTRSGVPVQAMVALGAVGATSFCAMRQLQRAVPDARPALARAFVALGVTSYLLGSYAVIRCASGSPFP